VESQEPAQEASRRQPHELRPAFPLQHRRTALCLYNALWQQKPEIKEEGTARSQGAVLGFQGLRDEQQHEAELTRNSADSDSFKKFVRQKTEQLPKEFKFMTTEYPVEAEDGQVKLKAKPNA
jgi:hypothetical protein